eukprot:PhM_4_TR8600/c0_g1_i1/m.64363
MVCVVIVAASLYNTTINVEVVLPDKPTLDHLREAVERTFSVEATIRRPNNTPEHRFRVDSFAIFDRHLSSWTTLLCAPQLLPFVQLYAYQPLESTLDDRALRCIPPCTPLNRDALRKDMEAWNAVRCRLDCVLAAHSHKHRLLKSDDDDEKEQRLIRDVIEGKGGASSKGKWEVVLYHLLQTQQQHRGSGGGGGSGDISRDAFARLCRRFGLVPDPVTCLDEFVDEHHAMSKKEFVRMCEKNVDLLEKLYDGLAGVKTERILAAIADGDAQIAYQRRRDLEMNDDLKREAEQLHITKSL